MGEKQEWWIASYRGKSSTWRVIYDALEDVSPSADAVLHVVPAAREAEKLTLFRGMQEQRDAALARVAELEATLTTERALRDSERSTKEAAHRRVAELEAEVNLAWNTSRINESYRADAARSLAAMTERAEAMRVALVGAAAVLRQAAANIADNTAATPLDPLSVAILTRTAQACEGVALTPTPKEPGHV